MIYYLLPQIACYFINYMKLRSFIKFLFYAIILSLANYSKANQLAIRGSVDLSADLFEDLDDSQIYSVPELASHEGEVVLSVKRLHF